ncbi:OFA family MFS transporter, partial [Thermodesulfovibrionales bacterium]|nr:OFA family MFS transporter [Thermodesulfovibrionales bacterium]
VKERRRFLVGGSQKQYYRYRRLLLINAIWAMMVISIYQYSWFLFSFALSTELKWSPAVIGITFTVFAFASTFIQPFSGYIADLFGPRKVSVIAAILVGMGFFFSSFAATPMELYFYYGLGSVGVGILYGLSTASAIKWFPEKRGLAVGLAVFGFGGGTALFNWPILWSLEAHGLRLTFQYVGLLMLVGLIPAAFFYKYPPSTWDLSSQAMAKKSLQPLLEFKPQEMLKTYQWFLIYFCFAFTISIILLFAAHLKMIAQEYNLPAAYLHWLLALFPLGNGLSKVVAGAVSDRLGREKTMTIFFGLLGFSIFALLQFGYHPLAFVAIVFIAALLGGSPLAVYPATIGDYYGARYSTMNYGITYTAKAWAGLISGWASGYFVVRFGSFQIPLILLAVCSLLAALFSNPRWMRPPSPAR